MTKFEAIAVLTFMRTAFEGETKSDKTAIEALDMAIKALTYDVFDDLRERINENR